jgi:hypothetical protein
MIENAGTSSETIEDDVGHAFCDRIDEVIRYLQLELSTRTVHDSMMPLREIFGNGWSSP